MPNPRWKIKPAGSTWGDFGPDDQLGRLNLVTPEKVRQGVAEVREGEAFGLSMPLGYPRGAAPPAVFAPGGPRRPCRVGVRCGRRRQARDGVLQRIPRRRGNRRSDRLSRRQGNGDRRTQGRDAAWGGKHGAGPREGARRGGRPAGALWAP